MNHGQRAPATAHTDAGRAGDAGQRNPPEPSARPTGSPGATAGSIGFFTVLEHEQFGFVGGYLLLNFAGRPLEFHCTAPVKPNRAQQILFGPTLTPYLYGEQIGQALLTKSSLAPAVVCTDVEPALAVRDHVSLPVALVIAPGAGNAATATTAVWRVDAAHSVGPHLQTFSLGRNQLAVPLGRDSDRQAIGSQLENLGEFDLREPFERIREAIDEAHKTALKADPAG